MFRFLWRSNKEVNMLCPTRSVVDAMKIWKEDAWQPRCAAPRPVNYYALFLERDSCTYAYVLRTTKYIRRKIRTKTLGGQISRWNCRTCVQTFSHLLKRRGQFDFSPEKMCILRSFLFLLGFSAGSSFCFMLHMLFHMQISCSNVCVKRFKFRHCLEYQQSPRS